uniref:30S ribosomal protein S1 n=1 Tax=Phaeostrophion irregulare TaxID=243268 RepID=UPI002E75A372|nr:30S ribosomal protein S1 [Phaeostrophion irregulare]WAM64381.1 30S ribosomal protein S1 [Phaeostrophion irregulare]
MASSFMTSNFEVNCFTLILSEYEYIVKQNDILAGSIIGLESTHALVDLGLAQIAFLPLDETTVQSTINPYELLKTKFTAEFLILNINDKTDEIIVSLRHVHSLCLWERLKQINFQHTVIYAKKEDSLSKGKLIFFKGLRIFALNAHIPKYYRRKKDKNFFMPFKFIEIKDFVHVAHVNSRLAIFSESTKNLKIGSYFFGNINSIKDFGIFLNILGIRCLLHISQISKKRIPNIDRLYKRGDQIRVEVIHKDMEQGKISVSLKKLITNPHLQL